MAHRMTRREFAALGGAGLGALALGRPVLGADSKTLRFIVRTDLRVLDPIWTTAYVSRNHGYMIFDTLFAVDSTFKPQRQMVGDCSISPDKLQYRFALRPGLKFHDGPSSSSRKGSLSRMVNAASSPPVISSSVAASA